MIDNDEMWEVNVVASDGLSDAAECVNKNQQRLNLSVDALFVSNWSSRKHK